MSKKLFIFLQYTVPQVLLTRLMGIASECRWKPVKNYLISRFIKRFQVDLSLTPFNRLEDYPSLNVFFTRALKEGVRPIAAEIAAVVSPVDGCISQIGQLEKNSLLQAKGATYTVDTLLGEKTPGTAEDFYNGHFATFYLSPKDYHRVHMPLAGKLLKTTYIPGKLFSVNAIATEMIPQLFARNERLVCHFETAIGPMVVVLVGAMLVGKIETVWGLVERSRTILTRTYSDKEIVLAKGAELGRFNMGSSVVILFKEKSLAWLPELKDQTTVNMGQQLATALRPSL